MTLKKWMSLVVIFSIYIISWLVQDTLFLNWDVSMLIHSTRQWLAGGSYLEDFFTPNPPMILYLYAPTILLSNLFNISIPTAFNIYIFLFATVSYLICFSLISPLLQKNNKFTFVFLAALLGLYLFFPMQHFGQRDHLLLMTSMPYLLVIANRLQGENIRFRYGVLIGLFAGLGFALKPQFLFIPILLEVFFLLRTKTWFAWWRSETIGILLAFIFYMLSLAIYFQDYLFVILPYMSHHYYKNVNYPWWPLVFNEFILFCIICMVFYALLRKDNPFQTISQVLLLSLLGALFSFWAQRSIFYYHVIPAFSFAILLLIVSLQTFWQRHRDFFVVGLAIIFFLIPLDIIYGLYQSGLLYKKNVINSLITFMNSQPPRQSIYVFSEANYSTPLIDYTSHNAVHRFDCLWLVEDLVKRRTEQGDLKLRQYIKNNNDKYFLINMIAEDFNKHKPDLVFIDIRKVNVWFGGNRSHFDFLNYFLENKQFKQEWNSYAYLTTIEGGDRQYQLAVYKRIKRDSV